MQSSESFQRIVFHSQEVAGLYKNFENLSKKWWFFYKIFDKSHLNLNGCKKKNKQKKNNLNKIALLTVRLS